MSALHVKSVEQWTVPADRSKYRSISHEIILIAGDQIEEAGRDLDTPERRREMGEVLTRRAIN